MRIHRIFLALVAFMLCDVVAAQQFDDLFEPNTLRLDYIMGGNANQTMVMLNHQRIIPGWSGKRIRLNQLPMRGNGIITVTDVASGDTIYRNSFSTLFHEWLGTEEAQSVNRAFEATYLVPQPKNPADIEIALLNSHGEPLTSMTHRYDDSDVLIQRYAVTDTVPYRFLHRSSRADNVINIAILAEGYTTDEMDSFYEHAQTAVDAILSHEPFASRPDDFNFVAVASPSDHTGVSVPRLNDWRQTAVGSNYSTFYSDRYLTTNNVFRIHDLLEGIPYEHIIILANTEEYGGGGIYNSYTLTTSREKNFRPVVVHEFGHSFGGLADEYAYEGGDALDETYPVDAEPWEPNITTLIDFEQKWPAMLAEGTPVPTPIEQKDKYPVGVYEGAGYKMKGIYRPADECRMRNNTYPTFCPVCVEALNQLIDFYTRP